MGEQAALYLRVSREDGDRGESGSIENQRRLLRCWAEENGIGVLGEYVDDGVSGTTFQRPEFRRLLRDIQRGTIRLLLVKDLSRLGRDCVRMGLFTEEIFPALGVRVIAVNDGYDSERPDALLPFRNVLNELYARDLSGKIRSAMEAGRRAGKYMGALPPYGYRRDPEDRHHLLPDPEPASVVREIFHRAAKGASPAETAEILNRMGILPPLCYRRQKTAGDPGTGMWSASSVRKILRNPVYLGDLVQGKTKKLSFKSGIVRPCPKESWIVTENAHEPLVSREEAALAKANLSGRLRRGDGAFCNQFAGLAFCADCGNRMSAVGTRRKTGKADLVCGRYKRKGRSGCTGHFLPYEHLCRMTEILLLQHLSPTEPSFQKNHCGLKTPEKFDALPELFLNTVFEKGDGGEQRQALLRCRAGALSRSRPEDPPDLFSLLAPLKTGILRRMIGRITVHQREGCLQKIVIRFRYSGTPGVRYFLF